MLLSSGASNTCLPLLTTTSDQAYDIAIAFGLGELQSCLAVSVHRSQIQVSTTLYKQCFHATVVAVERS